jgi:hypothetical protein
MVAAVHCCGLLDENCDFDAVFCEQHEDILLRLKTGLFRAIQIKTRLSGRSLLKTFDDDVFLALRRFVTLEQEYGDVIKEYVLATNHAFMRTAKAPANLPLALDASRHAQSSRARSLPRRLMAALATETGANQGIVLSALRKTRCQDENLPKLRDAEHRLEHDLRHALGSKVQFSSTQIAAAARALVGAVMRASADAADGAMPLYLRSGVSKVALEAHLAIKRIEAADVRRIIEPYLSTAKGAALRATTEFVAVIEHAFAPLAQGEALDVLQAVEHELSAGRLVDSKECRFSELVPRKRNGRTCRLTVMPADDRVVVRGFPHLRDAQNGKTAPEIQMAQGRDVLYAAVPAEGVLFRLTYESDAPSIIIRNDATADAGRLLIPVTRPLVGGQ